MTFGGGGGGGGGYAKSEGGGCGVEKEKWELMICVNCLGGGEGYNEKSVERIF